MGDFAFIGLTLMTLLSAFFVVTSSNLVRSAVALLFTLFGTAGLYIYLYADFIAATQIVIYVGGILVLIIFGVMLTNKIDDPKLSNPSQNQLIAGVFCLLLLIFQFQISHYYLILILLKL